MRIVRPSGAPRGWYQSGQIVPPRHYEYLPRAGGYNGEAAWLCDEVREAHGYDFDNLLDLIGIGAGG